LVCSDLLRSKPLQGGFSLLELLVVLVLMGSVAGLVVPDLWKNYVKSSERSALFAFSDDLKSYRLKAFRGGIVIAASDKQLDIETVSFPMLPDGWELVRADLINFYPSGATSGGVMVFRAPSRQLWKLRFSPLHGEVNLETL